MAKAKAKVKGSAKRAAKSAKTSRRKHAGARAVDAPKPSPVTTLLAGWPPLPEVHRDAFRGLVSEDECERLGAKTKAAALLKEATAWCRTIDRALREHPFALRRYGAPRFVWLLECVHALEDAVRAGSSASARGATVDARMRILERVVRAGREAQADLAIALEVVAAGRSDAEAKLVEAAEGGDSPSALAANLRALADLADELGRAFDARTRALVASVTLRADDAVAARTHADAIEAAEREVHARADARHDDPGTNRLEGRVLAEMRFVKRLFDRVRARNPAVPSLAPSPSARSAFGAA